MKRMAMVFLMTVFMTSAVVSQETHKLVGAPDIVPPATAAMQHPEFWINRIQGDPDRVIMTNDQIEALNAKNATRPLTRKDINGATVMIDSVVTGGTFGNIRFHIDDPLEMRALSGDVVRALIGNVSKSLLETEYYDRRRIVYPDQRKQEIIDSMQEGAVPEVITPRHGITVRHTRVRVVPTHDRLYRGQNQWLDMMQSAVLEAGQPVAILYETKARDWLLVRGEYTTGWIPAENAATGQPREIRRFVSADDFVVATNHKVPVYADIARLTHLTDIYLGARLPLRKATGSGYNVLVPVRRTDGTFEAVPGWIAPDAEVSVGYQPYTQRNAITTFFRLLNRPYGWGGTENERDCVGTIRAVMRTFGINTPRWTVFQLYHTDHVTTFPRDLPKEEKYRLLSRCEPGITVCGFDWHVVLYLGQADGNHYVIHQNGFSYHGDDGTEYRVGRVSVNTTELEGGADINRWTELSVFKP